MLTHAEIYIIKIALQQGLCTKEEVLSEMKNMEGQKSLSKRLMGRELITRRQWNRCIEKAKTLPQYPDRAENIHKDNQILLEYFQKHTSLPGNLLEGVWKESQHQSQTSLERIDEILLKEKAITREDLFSLGIYDGHPLSCMSCQYTISLSRYYPWHRIPCLFCVSQLVGATSKETKNILRSGYFKKIEYLLYWKTITVQTW